MDNLIIFFKINFTKLAIFSILIYQLYFVLLSNGSFFELNRKKEFLQFQSSSNNVIKKNNEELLIEIEKLKSGYEIFESIARKELGMIRENEVFVKILY